MNIAEFAVKNRVFANLLLAVTLLWGAVSYLSMPREVFPAIPLDMIIINTLYNGATPYEVEQQITIPVENALEGMADIEFISSQSYENISMIEIKIQQGAEDLQKLVNDIKDEMDKIKNYPSEAEKPVVLLVESEVPVITVNIAGNVSEEVRRRVSEDLKSRLLTVSGVARIQESGLREREIWVEADPYRLSAMHINPGQVAAAIRTANVNIPSGVLSGGRQEYPLRTLSELKTAEDVANIVIRRDNAGREVRVSDVAMVSDGFEERTSIGRLNGKESVSLMVMKTREGSTIEIVNRIKGIVEKYSDDVPEGISINLNQDSSRYIRERLKTLYVNGAIGLFLVCVVLFLFLNWRMAFWTAIGIPASFMGAIIMMDYFGITINMMSLFSLILVLGMVVDDAIIVTENVYRYLQAGLTPHRAAIKGTMEVVWPITAATSTTIAAFLPMLLMTGIMGKFISTIPIVVSLCLIASFVEAFIILPSHLADFAKPSNKPLESESEWFRKMRNSYRRLIVSLLKVRYRTVAVSLAVFLAAVYFAAVHMKFILFNSKDIIGFVVRIEMPEGTSLENTAEALRKVEELAVTMPKEDLAHAVSMVGMTINYHNGRVDFGSHLAQTMFESTEFETPGRRNGYEVLNEVREKLKYLTGVRSIEIKEIGGGPPVGSALEARISGDNYETLLKISEGLQNHLRGIGGVKDLKDDFIHGKNEIHIVADEGKLSLFGLSENDVSSAVKAGFDGIIATTARRGSDDIDVRVVYDTEHREDIDLITQIPIVSPSGKQVRLSTVADIEWKRGYSTISHFNSKRTIKVFAEVDTSVLTAGELSKIVKEYFSGISENYPGYSLEFGGQTEEQTKSLQSLFRSTLIGLLVIYLILGTLFKSFSQPFIVIASIPFSFIGVVIGHAVMGEPIGMLSMVGLAALTGIVINDSLVMVDFINNARYRGGTRWGSIIRSAFVRFRPVILTSLTTIFGLATLAFKTSGQAAFLAPMAISIVFGLIFSTILTLVVIPCLYAILDDFLMRIYGTDWKLNEDQEADAY
ncbi:MAG: efflux RND transporter permease subunit [Nitrospinota bacterium]|nr:efflux RND transporter permease subunit [Nitrospinota bacterium]